MPKRLFRFLLSVVLLLGSSALAYPLGASSGLHSHSGSGKASSSQKNVHVRSYTRKDGTVVRAYDRSAPGTKVSSSTPSVQSSTTASTPVLRDSNGKIRRSAAAKAEFERQTGYPHGRPGYVVDHIVPLACGGADVPSNMQWQTVADAKAKDATERIGCK